MARIKKSGNETVRPSRTDGEQALPTDANVEASRPLKEDAAQAVVEKTSAVSETPMMKQFYEIKRQYPEALLLFRVGDFYETYGEDAVFASKVLNIIQTRRSNGAAAGIEMAGFPHHAL